MTMTPRLRKFALTAHVTFSVGWLGAVVGFLALAITGLSSPSAQLVRASYLAIELTGWLVIVPFCFAALLTGLVQSLGTEWGLFRYYWVLVKFLLTVLATVLLLVHMQVASRVAGVAAETTLASGDLGGLRVQLVVDAVAALVVLLSATALSVFKPWGRTPYGLQKLHERRKGVTGATATMDLPSQTGTPWGLYVLVGIIGLVLVVVLFHVIGGGHAGH
jgi:hypothetical protein